MKLHSPGRPVKIIIRYYSHARWFEHPETFTEHEYEKAKAVAYSTYIFYEILVVKEYAMVAVNQEPSPSLNYEAGRLTAEELGNQPPGGLGG